MATVTTIVEIAASPRVVRSVFLDFPSMHRWHSSHFRSITVLESTAGTSATDNVGETLVVGDKIRIDLGGGMSFKALVAENSASRFVWRGGLSRVLIGEHSFQFEPSKSIPGGTTLIHAETFTGGLVSVCRPFMKNDKARKSPGFEKFNADIKKWAEDQARIMEE